MTVQQLSTRCGGRFQRTPEHNASCEDAFGQSFVGSSAALLVELPGIEPDALPGNMRSELPVRSISFRFSPARYLRFRSRVLTASRGITNFPAHRVHGASADRHELPLPVFCGSLNDPTARPSRVQSTALVAVVLLSSPTTRSTERIRNG
jgi:hypothetical protein